MTVATIAAVLGTTGVAVLGVVWSLCVAAARADRAMDAGRRAR